MNRMTRSTAIMVALLVLAACGSGPGDSPKTDEAAATSEAQPTATSTSTTTSSAPSADPAFGQLCDVLATARAGDLEKVRTTFDHGPLHTLAEAAIAVDRAVAARLLKAKEAVESDLTDPAMTAEQISTDLEALTQATGVAYGITGNPQPSCEELQ